MWWIGDDRLQSNEWLVGTQKMVDVVVMDVDDGDGSQGHIGLVEDGDGIQENAWKEQLEGVVVEYVVERERERTGAQRRGA